MLGDFLGLKVTKDTETEPSLGCITRPCQNGGRTQWGSLLCVDEAEFYLNIKGSPWTVLKYVGFSISWVSDNFPLLNTW